MNKDKQPPTHHSISGEIPRLDKVIQASRTQHESLLHKPELSLKDEVARQVDYVIDNALQELQSEINSAIKSFHKNTRSQLEAVLPTIIAAKNKVDDPVDPL